jgi:hypothetical protein
LLLTKYSKIKIMENQVQSSNEKSNRKLHAVYLLIIFLLGGLCVFLGLQYKTLKSEVAVREITITNEVKEREQVEDELKSLRDQYAQLETSDKTLSTELEAKKAYIDSLIIQAEKHKGDAYIIAKLRKETETLRKIMKGYIVTIDSLNQLNGKLIAEKKDVLNQLDDQKNQTKQMADDRDKLKNRIDRAALLSAFNVRATGIKSSRGGKKDTETTKASKADKIRVTFDLSDNDLTAAGPHDIYIRIVTPDAQEMTKAQDAQHQFSFGGTNSFYAAKKTIDYQNQAMSVLVSCEKPKEDQELISGNYLVEIYSDGVMIGSTQITLE